MLTQSTSPIRPLGRSLLAASLLLGLSLLGSCSQASESPVPGSTTSPALKISNALIFIDAQRQDSTALHQLNQQDIASMNVVKGEEARNYDPGAKAAGVLIVTTKQNQNRPDVVAFNARQHLKSTTTLAQKTAQLPPDAAYFLNGKASTREVIAGLDTTAITRTDVLQGAQAAAFAHNEKVKLAVSVYAGNKL